MKKKFNAFNAINCRNARAKIYSNQMAKSKFQCACVKPPLMTQWNNRRSLRWNNPAVRQLQWDTLGLRLKLQKCELLQKKGSRQITIKFHNEGWRDLPSWWSQMIMSIAGISVANCQTSEKPSKLNAETLKTDTQQNADEIWSAVLPLWRWRSLTAARHLRHCS